ncbi:MAG TPA: peroxidase family protein [Candidatus Methylomirabilis sp.]|nr:peroxidase family protein [Candidatus Methylomirabilis sp.]
MASFIKSDLEFILQQIVFAERHAAGEDLRTMFPNTELPFGLRTIDGSFNNLIPGRTNFGAADTVFPRLTTPVFRPAENVTIDLDGPGPLQVGDPTSYQQTSGFVFDSQPRTISNLVVDQTATNPAAVAAAAATPGSQLVTGTRADGTPFQTFFIPNVAPDAGLSAPFNQWMTFFGQFFDHGLDLVTKGGSGTVFIPLQPDDPLFVPGSPTNFMVLTRATNQPGPDGVLGTADDIHEHENTTSPFVDQNQTYSSHPSHQVFLRAYERNAAGDPVATGKLIVNRDLGADGVFGTADDVVLGGMATWKVVKAQARDILGINLTDADVFDVPLLATDPYGNFLPGPNGFVQMVVTNPDGTTSLVEGNPAAPISTANAVRTGHQFLIDIANTASPVNGQTGAALTPDPDTVAGGPVAAGTYDNELLDAHYIAGDGRVNENIGLTAVHHIFHSEHNRLVEHVKSVILQSGDVAFLNQWLLSPVAAIPADPATLVWDGERLFQAAKFGTEMQYQHLVFEEFARTIQPQVDAFLDFDDTINPAITAEFAHTVYRFGHSMLLETIDRRDPTFASSEIGLIQAFLNPLAFDQNGTLTAEQAAGAIVRGVTRQVGNEIDEFVTEALRNNLLGLPLDLATINLARGRDTGIPSLNAARRTFYAGTGDSQLKPYTSWADFVQHLKHEESLINFIAAYGTHATITGATTLADKRAAATLLVLGGAGEPADRLDFLHSAGAWASGPDGVTITGLDAVDFWIGGLAEEKMPFGGMLGSTFNFVFETQLEALQDGDRLYYLHRNAGLNFLTELENNSFAKLIMLNTDATHLPALVFSTPGLTLEVDPTRQFNANVANNPGPDGVFGPGPGPDGIQGTADDTPSDDIATPREDPLGDNPLIPLVIRDNPATAGPDTNYLQYTGPEHVVLGGTAANDILISSEGDDTLYGDGGNDRLEGGFGNDDIQGGEGDDIITDIGGDDVLKGDAGNDVIHGGQGLNLIIAGPGNDFVVTGEDSSEVFAGPGDDFIRGSRLDVQLMGGEGNDWIELGTQDGAPGDSFDPLGRDLVVGHDVFVGGGGFDEFIGEGGDDIMVGSEGPDKMKAGSGFDWATYQNTPSGLTADLFKNANVEAPVPAATAAIEGRFASVEGLSGSAGADILRGDDANAAQIAVSGFTGSVLTRLDLINGLRAFLGAAAAGPDGLTGTADDQFGAGNILLGGDGSDILEGRGGDDLLDGDRWLNVRISVRQNADGTGPEIRSVTSLNELIPDMMAGTINPGQLVIVREVLPGAGGFDTAAFSRPRANYSVTTNADGSVTVADITGPDGILLDDPATAVDEAADNGLPGSPGGFDRLTNIERLQFADQRVVLVPGLNAEPVGAPTINDPTPTTGQVLTASIAGVTDADNPGGTITGPVSFIWQFEPVPGSGEFQDISLILAPRGAPSEIGPTLTVTPDLAGFALRVKATYQDAHGVLEQVFSAATAPVTAGAPVAAPAVLPNAFNSSVVSPGVHFVGSDLEFILDQIKIAERHAAGESLTDILPSKMRALGLRTVDGSFNNLVTGQGEFGAADTVFPRMTTPVFRAGEALTIDPDGPGGQAVGDPTSFLQTSGFVQDSQPRTISNLIVDMTATNPAAVAAAAANPGSQIVTGTRTDGTPFETFMIPNVAPDVGLTAPFNAWMTFFGQFFDHGLDLVTKGGSGTVFVPLQPDDPLFVPGSPTNFMVLTRATNQPGPDGILGTADDIHEHSNTTSPFVDQNQTYTSHPSHQVFLRAYELNATGDPVDTGKLIVNRDLGADGRFGTADDVVIGGMATWRVVKAQARDLLGINLTDLDFNSVPLLATDAYGNFLRGPNGFVQVVMRNANGTTSLVEGNPAAPISLVNAVRTGHGFLDDIAHTAVPVGDTDGNPATPPGPLTPDADTVAGGPVAVGQYDNELLDAHYMAGDGRVNENIGLTTVHHIFHAEHNRLVDHTKAVVLESAAAGDVTFLNEWLLTPVAAVPADTSTLVWNGERLFQAAKFGTEMQYQHLVFEEFARTIQPQIDIFIGPTENYDTAINPAIVAEFAHTVYRFGHSMLTETIDRRDPNFASSEIGLIQAFLNPLAFAESGPTPEAAAGAIVRGVTRQVGNEIDEFVTEALRNNLLGLPLDLPAINLARARDTGVPPLNAARREFYALTGDIQLKPYISWADFAQHLKHPESLVNFIAAYGTHTTITAATTLADKRAAATALVLGGVAAPADRLDFLNSTGAFASGPTGITTTGLDSVDLWVGGLAEKIMPFGGMLGSTFNFVFETQLEKLQDGDRFYYLERNAGLNFINELENNSFAKMIMNNTDATHLPGLVFQTNLALEVDPTRQFNQSVIAGPDGIVLDDPLTPVDESADNLPGNADPVGGSALVPLVIRDNPATVGPDTNYLQYTGPEHAVLGGSAANDILIGSEGDDTLWGDAGNDRLEGGFGNDQLRGGAGDDILTDLGGDDNIQGDDGHDFIHGGNGVNLILGGFGNDFIVTGEDASEAFGGPGNDFILGSNANEQDSGNEGDDWLEQGNLDGNPGDNFDPLGRDLVPGNDIYIGSGQTDIMNGQGGDDIMVGSPGPGDKYLGASGFDWATFKDDPFGVSIDLDVRALDVAPVPLAAGIVARFSAVEGLSGSSHSDLLRGDNADAVTIPTAGAQGSVLTNFDLVSGLRAFVGAAAAGPDGLVGTADDRFSAGNILLGGDGSDLIEGRAGDDLIDGDKWLNVRISVRQNADGTGPEIASFDSMVPLVPLMQNGTYTPGQLVAVRELLPGSGGFNFDTANFSGPAVNYTVTAAADGSVTVTDNVGTDGTDRLTGIERLQFNDQALVLTPGLNAEPVGLLRINDPTPAVGQTLTVSAAGIADADNTATGGAVPGPFSFFWQFEARPGSGVFEDIVVRTGLGVESVIGPTFTVTPDLDGLALRVRAVYQDQHGVLEQVFSAATAPITPAGTGTVNSAPAGTVLLSDPTPTEGAALTLTSTLTDADGIASPISFQVQAGSGALFTDIPGATGLTFTPTQAEVGLQLRVVASFTDGGGTLETVTSAPTGPVGDQVIGTAGANTLTGTAWDDDLQGRAGADTLLGLTGDDQLLGEDGNDALNGGAGADTLVGGAGDDGLNGNAGADSMAGGPGNDTYVVDDAGDQVTELPGEGTDTVRTTLLSYTLADTLENLTFTGTGNYTGTGNALANTIFGDTGNDTLRGLDGNDGLLGGAGADTLEGGAGNDGLNGGTGADTLVGGLGNDTYVVDDAGDGVSELPGEGTDTVRTALASYRLGANVEHLTFTGTGPFLGFGNALGNTLFGGAGADTLSGLDGNDGLLGGDGNDGLLGGAGNDGLNGGAGDDGLNGGAGADTMVGGAGNDTFIVDDAGDVVLELVGGGTDTVRTALASYTLGTTVENLTFTGAGNFSGTGNALANTLFGGAGNDTLSGLDGDDGLLGGAGNDTLAGGAGNDGLNGGAGADLLVGGLGHDTYVVDDLGDVVLEFAGGGTDTVRTTLGSYTLGANLEHLVYAGTGPFTGTGNALANALTGGAGADTLDGAAGADRLFGGLGNDTYRFARGGGQDTVQETDATPGNTDTVLFGATITPLDLVLSRQGNDLRLALHGSTDRVTVLGWYTSPAAQTEVLQAGSGQQLLSSQVDQLIQTMAAFSAQTGLTWDQAIDQRPTEVQAILAASWG